MIELFSCWYKDFDRVFFSSTAKVDCKFTIFFLNMQEFCKKICIFHYFFVTLCVFCETLAIHITIIARCL